MAIDFHHLDPRQENQIFAALIFWREMMRSTVKHPATHPQVSRFFDQQAPLTPVELDLLLRGSTPDGYCTLAGTEFVTGIPVGTLSRWLCCGQRHPALVFQSVNIYRLSDMETTIEKELFALALGKSCVLRRSRSGIYRGNSPDNEYRTIKQALGYAANPLHYGEIQRNRPGSIERDISVPSPPPDVPSRDRMADDATGRGGGTERTVRAGEGLPGGVRLPEGATLHPHQPESVEKPPEPARKKLLRKRRTGKDAMRSLLSPRTLPGPARRLERWTR